jgi:hypothetical protein
MQYAGFLIYPGFVVVALNHGDGSASVNRSVKDGKITVRCYIYMYIYIYAKYISEQICAEKCSIFLSLQTQS